MAGVMFGLRNRRQRPMDGIAGALSGNFDLQADVLVGWVDKLPVFSNAGTRVEAVRGCEVVAGCDVQEDRGSQRMAFTMPMDGLFTVKELAREDVRLTARNLRGDTGVLSLHGATRVELIREFLGVSAEPIIDLDFTRRGNARSFLGDGWSGAEEEFTWTTDTDSIIWLRRPLRQGIYRLRMRYRTFVAPFVPTQPMEIYLDEQPIGCFIESDALLQFREVRSEWLRPDGGPASRLRLHHPHAARPRDFGTNDDGRRLAYAFRRLSVVRELPDQPL